MKKRLISRRVLKTELSYAMQRLDTMDFGAARQLIADVLARVEKYDCVPEKQSDELAEILAEYLTDRGYVGKDDKKRCAHFLGTVLPKGTKA